MRAYAILDGGGVKGAALAGCLAASEELGIEFAGYGGTSAGSIVALLACLGFSGADLRRIVVDEMDFLDFLDDRGILLQRLKDIPTQLSMRRRVSWPFLLWKNRDLFHRINIDFGLYHSHKLRDFLFKKIRERLPNLNLQNENDVTFADLVGAGRPPLKIVASDLGLRAPVVYSARGGDERNGSVFDAVRASMSYPFVFRPVRLNDRYLVDGGVAINLPLYVFNQERLEDKLPVVAFDLVASPSTKTEAYSFNNFCGDMLSTALESSEHLLRDTIQGVLHIAVQVPKGINTLDFSISPQQRQELFTAGHSATSSFFHKRFPQWTEAQNQIEQLQALYAPPRVVVPVLRAAAKDFEENTPAKSVRCNVMLPTEQHTRIVVYQYGMDGDPDEDLELALDGGCSGVAWSTCTVAFDDLDEAKVRPQNRNMTVQQQSKVRPDRKAMLSVPIFRAGSSSRRAANASHLDMIGTFSVDTSTSLEDTQWRGNKKEYAIDTATQWTDILGRILT
jgi:NTE family protein